MRNLREFRAGKPSFYPDQSIYAAFACAEFGLAFADLDGGTGLVVSVASQTKTAHFGAGRCSWYPQNDARASTLASDKYFTNVILERAGVPTLGGDYFFLHPRRRAHRPPGHEWEDAREHFRKIGGSAFVKPLTGSRGDFAQILRSEAALARYLGEVSQVYDAILMQPVAAGLEYRIFLLDDEIVFCARKFPPFLLGDGLRSIRDLMIAHNAALGCRGLSPVSMTDDDDRALDAILPAGARWDLAGRTNWSAGGAMILDAPRSDAALALARKAVHALGLRVAAVDLFIDIEADAEPMRVIEINANPSIRLLEQQDRGDLILKIWRHSFLSLGLLAR